MTAVRADLADALVRDAERSRERTFDLCRQYFDHAREVWIPSIMQAPRDARRRPQLESTEELLELTDEAARMQLFPLFARRHDPSLQAWHDAESQLRNKQTDIGRLMDQMGWSEDIIIGRMTDIAGQLRMLLLRLRAPSMEPLELPPELAMLQPLGKLAKRAAEQLGVGQRSPPLSAAAASSLPEPHRSLALRSAAQLSSTDQTVGARLTEPGVLRDYLNGNAEERGRLPGEFVARVFDRMEKLLRLPAGEGDRLRAMMTDTDSSPITAAIRNLAHHDPVFGRLVADPEERRRVAELLGVWRVLVLFDLHI